MIESQTIGYVSRDVLEHLMSMIYGVGHWNVEIENENTVLVWLEMDSQKSGMLGETLPKERLEFRLRTKEPRRP